ncbi:GIY-YIG nuclease family protein [Tersicoccus solisilvae]|nr:GIY-YIG nuclease family protein [Tersicoccus solisilvae]
MTTPPVPAARLQLGHVLAGMGIDDLSDVLVIRHTYHRDGIPSPAGATPQRVLAYTREQSVSTMKFMKHPPRLWLVFMADGKRRSRFIAAYENEGELVDQRDAVHRYFDLKVSTALDSVKDKLVITWSGDAVNWAKRGVVAASFPVEEIAPRRTQPFPGFSDLLIDHAELQRVMDDPDYEQWRDALALVKGVYLIADRKDGRLYVGKADGGERVLGRWRAYAQDGHGGNVELKRVISDDPKHARHFQYSVLRVFDPHDPDGDVDAAEAHYKRALLSREFGHNRN